MSSLPWSQQLYEPELGCAQGPLPLDPMLTPQWEGFYFFKGQNILCDGPWRTGAAWPAARILPPEG